MPVYVVDDQRRIVFCNEATADWLGRPAAELVDVVCHFHASDFQGETPTRGGPTKSSDAQANSSDAQAKSGDAQYLAMQAAGLCPPPEAFAGQICRSTVIGHRGDKSQPQRDVRHAVFSPLGFEAGSCVGVMGLVGEAVDASEERSSLFGTQAADGLALQPARMHSRLAAFYANEGSRTFADACVGPSSAARLIRARLEIASQSNCALLLKGPPGSGLVELARAAFFDSARTDTGNPSQSGWFLPVDCGVLDEASWHTVTAQISLRSAGAANTARNGLLLKDVDRLDPALRPQLARYLSENRQQVCPFATASSEFAALSSEDRLAFMLSELVIDVPALMDRREDIPWLLQSAVERNNAAGAQQRSGFSAEANDLLAIYPWPNNWVQLQQVVHESHKRSSGPQIERHDLPAEITAWHQAARHPRRHTEPIDLAALLEEVERRVIEQAYRWSGNNAAKTAKQLGITRSKLVRRMQHLGIDGNQHPHQSPRPAKQPPPPKPATARPVAEPATPPETPSASEAPEFIPDDE